MTITTIAARIILAAIAGLVIAEIGRAWDRRKKARIANPVERNWEWLIDVLT